MHTKHVKTYKYPKKGSKWWIRNLFSFLNFQEIWHDRHAFKMPASFLTPFLQNTYGNNKCFFFFSSSGIGRAQEEETRDCKFTTSNNIFFLWVTFQLYVYYWSGKIVWPENKSWWEFKLSLLFSLKLLCILGDHQRDWICSNFLWERSKIKTVALIWPLTLVSSHWLLHTLKEFELSSTLILL